MTKNRFYIMFSNGLELKGLTELEMYKALYTYDFKRIDKFNVLDDYNIATLEVACYGEII